MTSPESLKTLGSDWFLTQRGSGELASLALFCEPHHILASLTASQGLHCLSCNLESDGFTEGEKKESLRISQTALGLTL